MTTGRIDTDVAVVGAGPAGSACALALAPHADVVLVDRVAAPTHRIGESLIPAARRVLDRLGVLEDLERQGHAAYLGNRSCWGPGPMAEVDFLRDPDGPGWHLDRRRFESFLRDTAIARGARTVAPAQLDAVEVVDGRPRVVVRTDRGRVVVSCRLVVDAGGRSAPLARRFGAQRANDDRLIALWLHGDVARESAATAGFSLIASEPDGWWYTAPVPVDGRRARVLGFHTEADQQAGRIADATALLERARETAPIAEVLATTGFEPRGPLRTTAANSGVLEPVAGADWLAIGDAAQSFDPLSSRGLFHALYTAMCAATACRERLGGDDAAFARYAADAARIRSAYDRERRAAYAAETRWRDRPFWARRG